MIHLEQQTGTDNKSYLLRPLVWYFDTVKCFIPAGYSRTRSIYWERQQVCLPLCFGLKMALTSSSHCNPHQTKSVCEIITCLHLKSGPQRNKRIRRKHGGGEKKDAREPWAWRKMSCAGSTGATHLRAVNETNININEPRFAPFLTPVSRWRFHSARRPVTRCSHSL